MTWRNTLIVISLGPHNISANSGATMSNAESITMSNEPLSTRDVLRQFDGGMKELVIYRVELVFDTLEQMPLADIVATSTAHGEHLADKEYWYFYSEGVARLESAVTLRITGSKEYSWDEYEEVWDAEVSGRFADAAPLPATVSYERAAPGAPPSPPSGHLSASFEHGEELDRVQLQLVLRDTGEKCLGTMTWHRETESNAPIIGPLTEMSLENITLDEDRGEWRWHGEIE